MVGIPPELQTVDIPRLVTLAMEACAFQVELYSDHGESRRSDYEKYRSALGHLRDTLGVLSHPAIADECYDLVLIKARLTIGF